MRKRMKLLSFFKGLSWLLFLNMLVKPLWIFAIDRQVQNIVGYETYGSYFSVLNLSMVFAFLADAGITNMLNQRTASGTVVPGAQLLRWKLLVMILYAAACLLAGFITGIRQWEFLVYVIAIQMLTSFFIFLRGIVTARQLFSADAVFSVLDKSLMILFCGSLIYTTAFGIIDLVRFLQIQTACTAIAVVCAAFFVYRKRLLPDGANENAVAIFRSVLPFATLVLLMSMHGRLDGFLLERIHPNGAWEAGLYASGFRLIDAANTAGYLAASFLVPFIARHLAEKRTLAPVILNTRHLLMLCALGLLSFTLVYGSWIQDILYHESDARNARVIQLCIAVLPAYYWLHVYGSVLTAAAKFASFTRILCVSVCVNLVLNLLLIPRMGAAGCAIAALVSQYGCAVACYIVATRSLTLPWGARWNYGYLAAFALFSAYFYFAGMAIPNVWMIAGIALILPLILIALRFQWLKKYLISLR